MLSLLLLLIVPIVLFAWVGAAPVQADSMEVRGKVEVNAATGVDGDSNGGNPVAATSGQEGQVINGGNGGSGDSDTETGSSGADGGKGLQVYGGQGGSAQTYGGNGGSGGDGIYAIGGAGGDVNAESEYAIATPGTGGQIYLEAGAGGAAVYSPKTGAPGGQVFIESGAGGASDYGSGAAAGGVTVEAGLGGHAGSGAGGVGGTVQITAGGGGGGGAGGAEGGHVEITAGQGGDAGTGSGGLGGEISLLAGSGNRGNGGCAAGGPISLTAGNGANSIDEEHVGAKGGNVYLNAGLGGSGSTRKGDDGGVQMTAGECRLLGFTGGLLPNYSVRTWTDDPYTGGLGSLRAHGTPASPDYIANWDVAMAVQALGWNQVPVDEYSRLGTMLIRCDVGTVSSSSMPGRFEFWTTPAGSLVSQRRMSILANGQVCFGDIDSDGVYYNPNYPYDGKHIADASGAYLTQGGVWQDGCSRAYKKNITSVAAADAWGLLDRMQVVDYEYRKQETRVRMKDDRVLTPEAAEAELRGLKGADGLPMTLIGAGAKTFTVRTEEGSGEWHRGFIAEDMPAKLVPPARDGISALDVAANNTAALQEAKRRILALETRVATLEEIVSGKGFVLADSGLTTGGVLVLAPVGKAPDAAPGRAMVWAERVGGATELRAQNSTGDVTALTQHGAGEAGWVEVALSDAVVEAPEMQSVQTVQAVTRYRINWETKAVESYEDQETVVKDVPTGKTIPKLADGIRFDAATGKCWRWVGQ